MATASQTSSSLSTEQALIVEDNRLQAKARIRKQAHVFRSKSVTKLKQPCIRVNASLTNVPSTSRNPQNEPRTIPILGSNKRPRTQLEQPPPPLERDKTLGNYIEFDLSKLHNSKGGFLIDQDHSSPCPSSKVKTIQELGKHRERERERELERERIRDYANSEPGISLDRETRPVCQVCSSPEIIEMPFRRVFGIHVCKKCERENPESYSLLTKTEVKEDYLLTDAELRDEELLPHLLKTNPHKSTYSNMMLFCRKQVEQFAFSQAKWGSEQNLDAEFERRQDQISRNRAKKFQHRLAHLRRRTRDNIWQKRKDAEHHHSWEHVQLRGHAVQRCTDCGQEIEVEVF